MRWLGLAVGTLAIAWIATWIPTQDFADAIARVGVASVLMICAWHLVGVVLDARAWQLLLDGRASLWQCVMWRWIGESLNSLLPFAQVGGDVVRAHGLGRRTGSPQPVAASVALDVLSTAAAQVPFALLGLVLWAETLLWSMVVSVALLAAGWRGWRRIRDVCLRLLRRHPRWGEVHAYVEALTSRQWWRAFAWHLLAWVSGAGEIYLALWLVGHPVSITTALLIESVLQSARSLAFMVPAGLGIQEGTLLGIGVALGIPTPVVASIVVLKRAREVLLGAGGLLLWGVSVRDVR